MQQKKEFVTNGTAKVTPVLDIKEYHKQKLHETIKQFLGFDLNSFIEHQNILLQCYLEHEKPNNIPNVVFNTTFQTQFLSDLKIKWDNYVQFNNKEL